MNFRKATNHKNKNKCRIARQRSVFLFFTNYGEKPEILGKLINKIKINKQIASIGISIPVLMQV